MTADKCFSPHRRELLVASVGLAIGAAAPRALAQGAPYPTKPITMIVNVAAGSSVDVVARIVSAPLKDALGQPVVVDNRAGAAGNIGSELVVRAAPDGYTLLLAPASAIAINPFIYSKMTFDPFKDLVPVAACANITSLLVVRSGLPVNSAQELIAYGKANPGKLTYASPGTGSVPHLAAEILNQRTGMSTVHVPYKGALAALQDVVGGQVDFVFDPGTAISHIKGGKVRLIAVATPKRSDHFPNVATLDETGLKGFDASTTHGVYAPAATPSATINRLNEEVNKILTQPAVREQFAALGAEPTPMTPAQFRTLLENDAKQYAPIVRERKIVVD
jgi:tripartite-type tricarboxylate transporter receptor subunit TctC